MLPASYQLPAAVVLLLGGIVSCFFGHRLFRVVLALFGFILGALAASSIFGASDTGPMVVAAVVGGIAGAAILLAAYFVGVALVGAGLGALAVNLVYARSGHDPHVLFVVGVCIAGAFAAMALQRYFIITGTAFGGAWTMIVGALAVVGDRAAMAAAASGSVWVLYPMHPAPGRGWLPVAWLVLGTIGIAVQLGYTAGASRGGRKPRRTDDE